MRGNILNGKLPSQILLAKFARPGQVYRPSYEQNLFSSVG